MDNSRLESGVLNRAGKVVATCPTTAELFRNKLGKSSGTGRVLTITNGFDEADFAGDKGKPERFVITYIGTLAASYDLSLLAASLRQCCTENTPELILRFIGKADSSVIGPLEEIPGIKVEILSYVPHPEAISWMSGSAALLLVIPSGEKYTEMIPAKLFEYLASRRPVIALGRKGSDVDNILRETSGGRLFGNGEAGEMARYISGLMSDFGAGIYETNPTGLGNYSRRSLASTIAGILDSL